MGIEIREAKLTDLDSILELSQKLFEYERKYGKTFNMDWSFSEGGKKFFEDNLKHEDSIVLIAEDGKKPIGYLCSFTKDYDFRAINPITEIINLYVDDVYRYKGVGKLMFSKLKELLKKKGAKRVTLRVLVQNDQAIKFYKKIGFEEFELILEQNLE